jgi:membrane-bound ClpP family serine protease
VSALDSREGRKAWTKGSREIKKGKGMVVTGRNDRGWVVYRSERWAKAMEV